MKSVEEIQRMLVSEIGNSLNKIDHDTLMNCYNELFGDTSFLLAGYLEHKLRIEFPEWDFNKWIDDSLFIKVKLDKEKLSIWGIVIWGKEGVTEQWTEPFFFEILFNESQSNFYRINLLFSDLNNSAITYEEFVNNRDYWGNEYYLDSIWNPLEKNWRYMIHSNIEASK